MTEDGEDDSSNVNGDNGVNGSAGGVATIYAELLSNLAQLSIVVLLPQPATKSSSPKLHLSVDGLLTVEYGGNEQVLQLPASLKQAVDLDITLESAIQSYRLRLPSTTRVRIDDDSEDVPWSALALKGGASFSCKCCSSPILGPISTWRDLPSDNWAEMMDFWHCHKPDVPKHESELAIEDGDPAKRVYGFSNRIEALAGVGFVDTLYFLAHAENVGNIAFAEKTNLLNCKDCSSPLGSYDSRRSGYKLLKPTLSLIARDECFSAIPFISSFLLQQISQEGARFFTVYNDGDIEKGETNGKDMQMKIKLWITNPSVTYSLFSPVDNYTTISKRGVKLLYKKVEILPLPSSNTDDTLPSFDESEKLSENIGEETIHLHPYLFSSLLSALELSSSRLTPVLSPSLSQQSQPASQSPPSGQNAKPVQEGTVSSSTVDMYKDWSVAILDRF